MFDLVHLMDPCVLTVGARVETQRTAEISAGSANRQPVLVFEWSVSLIRERAEQNTTGARVRGSFCLSDWLKAGKPSSNQLRMRLHLCRGWITSSVFSSHWNLRLPNHSPPDLRQMETGTKPPQDWGGEKTLKCLFPKFYCFPILFNHLLEFIESTPEVAEYTWFF